MYRIDTPTAAGVLPAAQPPGAPGYFSYAPPGSGNTPTVLSSDWANGIQEELMAFLTYAGIVPAKGTNNQVLTSVLALLDSAGVNGTGSIFGLTTNPTAGATTTSITISVGQCRDSTNSASLVLGAPLAKSLTAVWAAGTGNGGRDTAAALANGQTWHMFLILNPTTHAVDALFSQSPTAPTLPAGYTKFRRLGAILLDAAATTIRDYEQIGDWFYLKTRSADYAAQANGGAASLRSVTVPIGIKVEANFYFQSTGTTYSATTYLSGLYDPDFGVPAAFGGATQWAQVRRPAVMDYAGNPTSYGTVVARVFTDTAGKIYTFSSDATDVIALGVLGWRDERGKFY